MKSLFDVKLFELSVLDSYCRTEIRAEHANNALISIKQYRKFFTGYTASSCNEYRAQAQKALNQLNNLSNLIYAKRNPPAMLFYTDF